MSGRWAEGASAAVLVPVKAFGVAKRRLAEALDDAHRRVLAMRLAEGVLKAAAPLPVAVVCDDDEVRRWAQTRGALVLSEPGRGLNGAVSAGVEQLAERGIARVVVAHADLARPSPFAWVAEFEGVTLVPDRHRDGTNVMGLPTSAGFRFSYGQGSFSRHEREARRLGLPMRVVLDVALGLDIDTPADLEFADVAPFGWELRPARVADP